MAFTLSVQMHINITDCRKSFKHAYIILLLCCVLIISAICALYTRMCKTCLELCAEACRISSYTELLLEFGCVNLSPVRKIYDHTI